MMTTSPSSYRERIESAVRDGAMLRNDEARAILDYVGKLEYAARLVLSEASFHRLLDMRTVLDNGPIEPE